MPLNIQKLGGIFCVVVEDKSAERNADDGGLACEVSNGKQRGPYRFDGDFPVSELRICGSELQTLNNQL